MKTKVVRKSDIFTWKRLRKEITPVIEEIVERVVTEKIENTKPKWADSVLTAADKAAGEYKKFDEEKTVLSGQVSEHGDAIEDIDERVKRIEKKFGFVASS